MKERNINIRMDSKLYEQLKRYADRNDEGVVSRTARKFLTEFLREQIELDKNKETI